MHFALPVVQLVQARLLKPVADGRSGCSGMITLQLPL
jgi:hypothetical protein